LQLDELIKSTEAAYANEEMPKEVSAAQTALRQHNDARNKLQQLIDFTSDEADQIIIRVRQQVIYMTLYTLIPGGHSPGKNGKPGKVTEFDIGQGKVREIRKSPGKPREIVVCLYYRSCNSHKLSKVDVHKMDCQ